MPFTFAWMLHGNDEGLHAKGGRQVAVNWVMPAGAPLVGQSPKVDGDSVFAAAGELMWPWRFDIKAWWAVDSTGLRALVSSDHSAASDRHQAHALLEAELYNRCAGCEDAFSLDVAHMDAGVKAPPRTRLPRTACARSSLPHVFTTLTHLPAALSQDVLGMVRGFACEDLAGPVAYAPQFAIGVGGREVTFTPAATLPGADGAAHVTVTYQAQYADGQPYGDVEFSVITNYADDAGDLAAITPALQASDVSEVGARVVLAANALSPLVLLGKAAPDGAGWPAASASPESLMSRTLGLGLLRIEDQAPIMIWERLPGADAATGDDLFAAWSETAPTFLQLANRYHTGMGAGTTLLAPLKPLFDPVPASVPAFAAAAAGVLDNAVSARMLMVAWLAATAVEHAQRNPTAFWDAQRSFDRWYDMIAAVVDEHEVAELLAGWWRYWIELQSGSADARVLEMRSIVDDWIRGKTDSAQIDRLAACYAHGMALLASLGPPAADMPADLVRPRIVALYERLRRPDDAAPVSLGEDRDLAVVIEVDAGKVQSQDELLRGYAIAMAAGFDKADAALGWQWLTDLAGSIRNNLDQWEDFTDGSGKRARFHDAIGAISEKGRTVVAFPYSGKPLEGAMRANGADSDGVDGLAFGWPADWKTPPLAYGLRYWTLGTPIGNAGKILNPDCAREGDDRRLKELDGAMFDGRPSFHYLCRVAPGAVTIQPPAKAFDMETESRAWHEQAGADPARRVRVAVIRPQGSQWRPTAPTSLEMELVAPDGTPKVLERWINADLAQRNVPGHDGPPRRDPASRDRSDAELRADRALLLERLKTRPNGSRRPRHPAARAIGVQVTFSDGGTALKAVLTPPVRIQDGYMSPGKITCTAAIASAASAAGGTLTLALGPGAIAKVTLWTLAPETFFASAAAPSALGRLANFESGNDSFIDPGGVPYRAFGEQQHWFECAPSAANAKDATIKALEAAQAALGFVMDGHDAAARIAVAGGVDATWLKGFLVQRHDWHWTGYPLALPRMLRGAPTLHDWSEAFAGTESLVESRVETLQAQVWPAWRFGLPEQPTELCRARLPGLHGARFVACVLRPLRRFDAWLKNEQAVENLVVASGRLVAARVNWNDPALRLAPPALRAAVPLVRTYEAAPDGIRIGQNGALLCLDDVLFRTDSLARFGGVGEIVDVDLEETRINHVFEMGPNPVMHAGPMSSAAIPVSPPPANGAGVPLPALTKMDLPYGMHYRKDGSVLPEAAPMDWRIEAGRPFGLTYDLDRNPKVVHTAIIVRPAGADVSSYWIMAKVRLRRMLDPGEDWTANGKLPTDGGKWLLARRPEGDDRIPFDFAIGDAPAGPFELAIGGAPSLKLKERGAKGRRLLCSWHKGHWEGTSAALWGLLVLDQVMQQEAGQWTTVERYSPFETRAVTKGMSFKDPGPVLLAKPAGASAQRLLLSDYGQAHWLTFIGMPFRHPSLANESWWMGRDGNAIELRRSGVGYGVELISRDLLINPVKAEHLNGTPASVRVEVETNTFHLLLVFARVNDIAAPPEGNPLGQLAGVYRPSRAAITETAPYPSLRFVPYMNGSTMPAGSVGYIYKFQSSVSDKTGGEQNPPDWETLLAGMFPAPEAGEATVRWLPEFVGPISSGQPVAGKVPPGDGIRIDLGALGKVELVVNQQRGWMLRRKDPRNPWQDDLQGGSCTLNAVDGSGQTLDVEGAGGRLLARLSQWNEQGGGKAVAYDKKGAGSEGNWKRI